LETRDAKKALAASSAQSPLVSVSAFGENYACFLVPPLFQKCSCIFGNWRRETKKGSRRESGGSLFKDLRFLRFSAFSVYLAQKPSEAGFVRKRRKNGAVETLPDRVE